MKKTFKSLIVFAAAALTLASCQKVENEQFVQNDGQYKYSFALVEDGTRAVIGDNCVEWEATDRVGMFVGDYTGYAKIDVTTTPKMVVLYSPTRIEAGTMAYAYAPYDAANKTATPDWVKITVNNIQGGAAVSAMPLAGIPFEVRDTVAANNQEGNGAIKFLNLGSVINFKIFSTEEEFQSETVKSVKFEATKPIAGVGYINLMEVDAEDEGTLELLMDEEEFTVRVEQDAEVPADKEEATPIKMVILPGTFEGILTVTTDVATYMKEIPERVFARSHSRTFGLDLAKAEREEGVEETVVTLPYEEAFTTNQGEFAVENITVPEGLNIWTFDPSYGAKATSYVGGSSADVESMLVSPWMDLTEVANAAFKFEHTGRYFTTPTQEATVWVKSDEEGAEWVKLYVPKYFSNSNWTFVNSGEISLADYVGKKVKVAFKYTSTESAAGTWEIKNFSAYTLKGDPGIAFGDGTIVVEATVDDEEIDAPELTNPHNLTVTYSSSNEDLAIVDETGYVLLMGEPGVVTITATFAGDDNYEAGEASYKIKITDPSSGAKYYTKITSTDDLTDGQYLIVYEGNSTHASVAFDGSLTTSLDVASNGVEVTIVESQIEQTEDLIASEFTITAKDGGYSVMSASEQYIGQTSYANGLKSSSTDDYTNTISFDSNGNALIVVSTSGGDVTLKYNYASDQLRFRYYKSGQQNIALYKLD